MAHIPHEIIHKILLRVPAKGLGRCSCVSRLWRSLISDPVFLKQHLCMSIACQDVIDLHLIATAHESRFYQIPISPLLADNHGHSITGVVDITPSDEDCSIVGCCRGLICFETDQLKLVVINPLTRKIRTLPTVGFWKRAYRGSIHRIVYGFGYDSVNDDYKVVGVCSRQVEVYSFREDSWRMLGQIPYELQICQGLYVSSVGALAWLTESKSVTDSEIVAIDLASEKWIQVSPLSGAEVQFDGLYELLLGEIGGCFCLFEHFGGSHLEIWVMKEFGVPESWAHMAGVPYTGRLRGRLSGGREYFEPVWRSKDGELILMCESALVVYNLTSETHRYPVVTNLRLTGQAMVHMESLVSPC
uniref:F-box domain-containing protein n=1 Tax=Kalanchoe fedtschenkoi TaxID=63787 RepID=A0A7N1A3W0_KALFE